MLGCLTELQQEQPQFYATLAGHLSAEDQTVIQGVMVKAEEIAQQQLTLAQQTAGATAGAVAPNGGAS
jgi:importin-7